jgi:hypothetical protein
MNAIEKSELLRQEAIQTLLTERDAIDAQLVLLGYEKAAPLKKRGRPKKNPTDPAEMPETDHSDSFRSASS